MDEVHKARRLKSNCALLLHSPCCNSFFGVGGRGPRPLEYYTDGYFLCRSTPLLPRFPLVYRHAETGVGGVPFGLGRGWGWGLGAPWLDEPTAFVHRPEPCPPSIRKRSACGFPQGPGLAELFDVIQNSVASFRIEISSQPPRKW